MPSDSTLRRTTTVDGIYPRRRKQLRKDPLHQRVLDWLEKYGVACFIVCIPTDARALLHGDSVGRERTAKRRKILASETEKVRLTDLFNQCFRIQREVSEAAGVYVPMVVENVRGAQEWVGKARSELWKLLPLGRRARADADTGEKVKRHSIPNGWPLDKSSGA